MVAEVAVVVVVTEFVVEFESVTVEHCGTSF